MYASDITKITPPATLAELAALDATREVSYLKARCNRMGIHVPGPNPQPAQIIPHIQQRLDHHLTIGPRALTESSGDYVEWKLIREEYEEFIAYLTKLNSSRPSRPSVETDPPQPPLQNIKTDLNTNPPQPRDNPGTHPGQGRDNPGTGPGQKRDNPGQTNPKSQQPPGNPRNSNADEPKTAGTTNDKPPLDPNNINVAAYCAAYFEQHGPPPREGLDKKPAEFQRYILTLIEDLPLRKAERQLMLPPPYGLYIATSKSALQRLRTRHHTHQAKRNQRSIKKHIAALLAQPDLPDTDVTRVTEQLLKLKLVQSSLHPDPDLTQTKTLIDMLEKIRAGKLAERKVALAESKP